MQNYLGQLAQGSGAINNPAPAAQLGYQQANQNQQGGMQGVGGIMQGAQGVYNNRNGPSGYTPSPGGWDAAGGLNTNTNNTATGASINAGNDFGMMGGP
jgi:hypothetical protein